MKILVADNHTLFREGFSRQLQRFDVLTELQEVTDFSSVTALADQKKNFDLIFIDRDVLGTEWKEKFQSLQIIFPEARLVMMSESEDQKDILDAFGLGAAGYITKLSPDSLIINALRLIVDGNLYVPPAVLKGLQKRPRMPGEGKILTHTLPNGKNLTYRQSEVLQHLSNGLSNKQIAYEMGISISTVKLHLNGIYTRLRVNNRVQALLRAREEHII